MNPFFTYLVQVNIALALFYLLYAIVLKRDTFLRLRRLFFLSAIVISFLYPFWIVSAFGDWWGFFHISGNGESQVFIEKPMALVVTGRGDADKILISWERIISLIYIVVTVVFFLRFMTQLISILRMKKRCEKQVISGISVYQLKDNVTSFSFFKKIFIYTENHSEAELFRVLLHEQTHARQWHSIDIILIEMLCLFSWWNPFLWLIRREMALNLEYLADSGVLREGVDSREYQYHLLRLTYQEPPVQIVNNFNVSQLKQRIMMMNKTKSPVLRAAKYLLIFPLVFLLIFANSCANRDKQKGKEETTKSESSTLGSADTPILKDTVKLDADNSDIFEVVEKNPEFPGGTAALSKWLGENINYPVESQENGIQGRVIVRFVVEKDGSVSNIEVLRGIDPSLDKESVRVIGAMPKWNPGTQRGQTVRVYFTLPVVYRLQK